MYIVNSYWIEGEFGEINREERFIFASQAEYKNKSNKLDSSCTFSEVIKKVVTERKYAKTDCSYCN